MSSRNPTPFIPPMTFEPSPQPPGHATLPASDHGPRPNWAPSPSMSSNTPLFVPSPYNGATPFIPQSALNPPTFIPGSYAPAPSHLPPQHPAGVSSDWHGYHGHHAGHPPGHSGAHGAPGSPPWAHSWTNAPPTVYNAFTQALSPPGGVPLPPAGSGWGPVLPQGIYNSPGLMPGPVLGMSLGGPGPQGPVLGMSLGGPAPQFGMSLGGPAPQLGMSLGGPAPQGPVLGMSLGAPHGYGPSPGQWPYGGAAASGAEPLRPLGPLGSDLIRKFAPGPHYGPVLDPLTLQVVKAKLVINPLLCPLSDNNTSQHVLEWNMLFPSRKCHRSDDPSHVSWMKGRDEPATFPRVSELRIFARILPWEAKIVASQETVGVTCADVIEGLDSYLHRTTGKAEFEAQPPGRRREITNAYWFNRSTAHDVPGGSLGSPMLRLDWLCDLVMFGGLVRNEAHSKVLFGSVVANVLELECVARYMLPEDEGLAARMRELHVGNDASRRSDSYDDPSDRSPEGHGGSTSSHSSGNVSRKSHRSSAMRNSHSAAYAAQTEQSQGTSSRNGGGVRGDAPTDSDGRGRHPARTQLPVQGDASREGRQQQEERGRGRSSRLRNGGRIDGPVLPTEVDDTSSIASMDGRQQQDRHVDSAERIPTTAPTTRTTPRAMQTRRQSQSDAAATGGRVTSQAPGTPSSTDTELSSDYAHEPHAMSQQIKGEVQPTPRRAVPFSSRPGSATSSANMRQAILA